MAYSITLIPGDGIGPEVTETARRVLEATGVSFHWDLALAGADAIEKYGTPLPDYVLQSIRKNRVALKSEGRAQGEETHHLDAAILHLRDDAAPLLEELRYGAELRPWPESHWPGRIS